MPFLQVTLNPPTTQVTLPNTNGNTKLVVVPLSVTTNPSLIFDAVPNVTIPLYAGVVFEYDAEFTIQNFNFANGTSGDTWLIYFNGNSDGSGIHYILTQGSSVNANITNGSLNVNASGTVNANITNSTLNTNANITNSSLNVNANVTNATLNANITNSTINETIAGQNITVYESENNIAGAFQAQISNFNTGTVGNYLQVTITIPPNGYIKIRNVIFTFYDTSEYYYNLTDDIGQVTALSGILGNNASPLPPTSTTTMILPPISAVLYNSSTSSVNLTTGQEVLLVSFAVNRVIYNSTTSNITAYYMATVNVARSATDNGIRIFVDYEGGSTNWFSVSYQNTGGSGSGGGSGGGGGHIKQT
jgi:hypothetical protein